MTEEYPKWDDAIVQKYVARLGEKITRMRGNLQAANWNELKVECHQLKGSGSSFGFPRITELSAVAEKKIIENSTEAAQAVTDLLAAIEEILKERNPK